MIANIIIPALDAIPVPGPIWLIWTLHFITFVGHLLAMNLMLTSALVALVFRFKQRDPNDYYARFYFKLVSMIPTLIALTVSFGVAPLLFVQVLYGQFIYTSSVAIGWFWISVIPMLIVSYYIFYHLKFRAARSSLGSIFLTFIGVIFFIKILFIFSSNLNLSIQPDRFTEFLLRSTKGWHLNLKDPSIYPRFLHMLLGVFAIGGVWFIHLGKNEHQKDPEFGRYIRGLGFRMFYIISIVNILAGFTYMLTLRRDVMLRLMCGGSLETLLWILGLIAIIIAMILLKRTVDNHESKGLMWGTVLVLLVLISMVLLRSLVRVAYLEEVFQLSHLQVSSMWGLITIFFAVFIVGMGILYWMTKVYYQSQQT